MNDLLQEIHQSLPAIPGFEGITQNDYTTERLGGLTNLAIQEASKKWRACPTKCFGYHADPKLERCSQSIYDSF